MAKIQKRRPGAGAKKKPANELKEIVLPIRLDSDIAAELKARAEIRERDAKKKNPKAKKWTPSRVARDAMKLGLQTMRDRDHRDGQPRPARALFYLLSLISNQISKETADGRRFDWFSDSHLFKVNRFAMMQLLDKIEPKGASEFLTFLEKAREIPVSDREFYQSVEDFGRDAFREIWDDFEGVLTSPRSAQTGTALSNEVDEYVYNLVNARVDLNVKRKDYSKEPAE